MESSDRHAIGRIFTTDYYFKNEWVEEIVDKIVKMPSIDPVSNSLLSLEIYEETALVVTDTTPGRKNPAFINSYYSDTDINGIYAKEIERLLNINAPRITGMSTKELLELPIVQYEQTVVACERHLQAKGKVDDEILDELENRT